tara:strand:- start:277 stop:495 length:219 start_codon:yes stop_codon:yes gene_type:complete
MTTQEKFENTRGLEKQVQELQIALQERLVDLRKAESFYLSAEKRIGDANQEMKLLKESRDAWREKACDLQSK